MGHLHELRVRVTGVMHTMCLSCPGGSEHRVSDMREIDLKV